MCMSSGFSVDWWALGVLMFEMMAGRSPFDIVGSSDNPDQNTEDYLFQGKHLHLKFKGLTKQKCLYRVVFVCIFLFLGISFMFKGIMWISFFSVETLKRRSVTMGFLPDVFTSLNAWISHFPFFFLLLPLFYSYIRKTDQNSPLVVSQSRQCSQRISQQGKTPDKNSAALGLCRSDNTTCLSDTQPCLFTTHIHNISLWFKCSIFTHVSPHHTVLPKKLLSLSRVFSPVVCPFFPSGSQRASRLSPSDRLRWHHGSSIFQKCGLGSCELLSAAFNLLPFTFTPTDRLLETHTHTQKGNQTQTDKKTRM